MTVLKQVIDSVQHSATIQAIYLDYINYYASTQAYADDNGLTLGEAVAMLSLGEAIHARLTATAEEL